MAASLFLMMVAAGCGVSTWRPAARHPFDPHSTLEINDQDIARAFEAKPQLPARPLRVAWFSWEPERREGIQAALDALPGVESAYAIPPLLVTGEGRFGGEAGAWPPAAPEPLSLKKLRLLAAQAQADVLLILDHGWRQTTEANGLAAFNVLLLPALFTPFLDSRVESYLDVFVVDVRNGYLYGQASAVEDDQVEYQLIYELDPTDAVDAQWARLLKQAGGAVGGVMAPSGP